MYFIDSNFYVYLGKINLQQICNTFYVCTVYSIRSRISKHLTQMLHTAFKFMTLLPLLQETKPMKYEWI